MQDTDRLRNSLNHFKQMWASDIESFDLLAYAESLAADVEWFLDQVPG